MNKEIVISIKGLNKKYRLYSNSRDRVIEAISFFKKPLHKDFYAIENISLEIRKGESVGIIGCNGAGKSTLLKMITGVLTPTSGEISTKGVIASLLELGAGFNPNATGLENIYLNGTIMGFTRNEIDEKLDKIIDFADIGVFIQQPVKSYSSGMFARLAFSVAINVDPDILIVDEALSVGDNAFQMKCLRRMQEFHDENKTILFVTHDTGMLSKFCTRGILLDNGTVKIDSSVDNTIKLYRELLAGEIDSPSHIQQLEKTNEQNEVESIREGLDSFGDQKAIISGVSIYNQQGLKTDVFKLEVVKILIKVRPNHAIDHPIIGFTIFDRFDNIVFQTNTNDLAASIEKLCLGRSSIFEFTFQLPPLNSGKYSISPAVASGTQNSHLMHHWIYDALFFDFVSNNHNKLEGYLYIDNTNITINEVEIL